MNRRTFFDRIIKVGVATYISTIITDKNIDKNRYTQLSQKILLQTYIDNLCATFPQTIPGAKKIEKILTDESEYCIIHLKESHPVDDEYMIQNYKNETLADFVARVQHNSFLIADYLCRIYPIKKLYIEGVTDQIESQINEAFYDRDGEIIFQALEEMGEIVGIGFNNIHISATESLELQRIAQMANKETGTKHRYEYTLEQQQKIFDDREKEAFERMMQEDDFIKLIAYGKEHTFQYETEKWNAHHQEKISLIEITPSED